VGFALFILLTASQILMPSAFFPELGEYSIYLIILICCLTVSIPRVLALLNRTTLVEQPITVCVLGLQVAVALSHLSHFVTYLLQDSMTSFFKLVLYYLLLVANVDSSARLRQFLWWITLLVGILTFLVFLQHFGVIDIESLRPTERGNDVADVESGKTITQVKANGVFSDPNDYCLILILSMTVCLYRMTDPAGGLLRVVWLMPLAAFGFALALTRSRGGFLGLLLALVTFLYARFGLKKAAPLAALALPVMFVLFAGRQTSLSTSGGTAQQRIQIWVEGVALFRQNPVFGVGFNRFGKIVSLDAHNSFLHAFVDLGFFGGMFFLGIFFYSLWSLNQLGLGRLQVLDPEMRRLRPYLMTFVAGYVGTMMSLSRAYIIPTYMVAGLVTVFLREAVVWPPTPAFRFGARLVGRMVVVGVAFMISMYLYTRFSARYGGG
jgi:hypothetical protein